MESQNKACAAESTLKWGGQQLIARLIPLERRFAAIEKEHLRDPDHLSLFGKEPEGVLKWPDLLERSPVIVLAEGRSGKTFEFKKQVERLKSTGQFAFFVPIERLHDEDFDEALDIADQAAFGDWRDSPNATGYFFLDAVDELKLRDGSLRKAVKKFKAACEPHFSRLRLFLSCRPADWHGQIDQEEIATLSASTSPLVSTDVEEASEAAFLQIISKGDAEQGTSEKPEKTPDNAANVAPTVLALLPLSQKEIRDFSAAYAPELANAFCNELEAHDLWHLYRLPAEIVDALDQMAETGALGNLETQIRQGIQLRLRENNEKKRKTLSVEKAQEGAERIALALFLLKQRSIKTSSAGGSDGVDIGKLLTDWSLTEQQELIAKPLFDPSGIGSVRFHHRASQEYLAAKRLAALRRRGMPLGDLFALLFGEIAGQRVVKLGLAPVAAWLSLWDTDIKREVLQREPQHLFRQGLPSAFPIEMRAEILRHYVRQYAGKDWCRTGVGHDQLRRIAHPDLGPVIRELWDSAYTGHDSRELLLELIWLTPIPDCTDLALFAALDANLDTNHRTYGARGVLAGGSAPQKAALARAVLDGSLPEDMVRYTLCDMVPELISVQQFVSLVDGMKQDRNNIHGLSYTIYQTAKRGSLALSDVITIRDSLAAAIWESRNDDCAMYNVKSGKDHYQDGLIAFCAASIPSVGTDLGLWARATVIALQFGHRQESIVARADTQELRAALQMRADLKEAYIWASVELANDIEGNKEDWVLANFATGGWRQQFSINNEDLPWLLFAVSLGASQGRRGVAFWAVARHFDLREELELQRELSSRIADRQDLTDEFDRLLNPPQREKADWEIENEKRKMSHARKEQKRIAGWLKWRSEVLADPDFLMGGDRRLGVLYDAHKLIKQSGPKLDRWGHWDGKVIRRAMGSAFLDRYRAELSKFWRETDVLLTSERTSEERNNYDNSWLLALSAVKAEADIQGWAKSLSHDEAVRATRISTVELNGFGSFVADLASKHPRAVTQVLSDEVATQLSKMAEFDGVPIVQDIRHHLSATIKQAVVSIIASTLATLPTLVAISSNNVLHDAVDIVAEFGNNDEKKAVCSALRQQIDQAAALSLPPLIALLAKIDPRQACEEILRTTQHTGSADEQAFAIHTFGAVFGDRHSSRGFDLNKVPRDDRVPMLHQLAIRAYQIVRREEDIAHEEAYSPGVRDHAQTARSFLFNALADEKHPDALAALLDLSKRPEFSHMADRLVQMAYECAAAISDLEIYPITAVQDIDRKAAFQPVDDGSLLRAMLTRLEAFEHDLLHAEDSPVAALQRLNKETELRPFIANWLRNSDRGSFTFTQEAIVIEEKRTDIRFQPGMMDRYGTVELKRETSSVRELEIALRDQLVGQYLRHERCHAGILLICQSKQKHWRHPSTNALMGLDDVVSHLSEMATAIMASRPELHIAVKGIDYSKAGWVK